MDELNLDQPKTLAIALVRAHRGKMPWLDRLVQRAGYRHGCEFTVGSKADVGRFFRVRQQTITAWMDKGAPEKNGDGCYELGAIMHWLLARSKGHDSIAERLREARARDFELRVEERGIKVGRLSGSLVPLADVERGNVERARVLKQALMRLSSELAPTIVGREIDEIRKIVQAKVIEMLNGFTGAAPFQRRGAARKKKKSHARS